MHGVVWKRSGMVCVPIMTEVSGIFWHLHIIICEARMAQCGLSQPSRGSLVIHTCITALHQIVLTCHTQTTIISLIWQEYITSAVMERPFPLN